MGTTRCILLLYSLSIILELHMKSSVLYTCALVLLSCSAAAQASRAVGQKRGEPAADLTTVLEQCSKLSSGECLRVIDGSGNDDVHKHDLAKASASARGFGGTPGLQAFFNAYFEALKAAYEAGERLPRGAFWQALKVYFTALEASGSTLTDEQAAEIVSAVLKACTPVTEEALRGRNHARVDAVTPYFSPARRSHHTLLVETNDILRHNSQ